MTSDEALEVLADEVTRAAMQEVVDNGLWDTYVEVELPDRQSAALRDRLTTRIAAGPDRVALSEALRALVE